VIKAVTFDFWNTLFHDTGDIGDKRNTWRVERIANTLANAGWAGSKADLYAAIDSAAKRGTEIRLQGIVDFIPEEQVRFIFDCLGISPGLDVYAEVLDAYTSAARYFPPSLMPGAVEVVREVAKYYPVGLISITGITPGSVLREVISSAGILDSFKTLTFSNEVKIVKPNPQIFLLTAENLSVDVRDILHIGDDYDADITGANRVGAKGVWLNPKDTDSPGNAFAVIKELAELVELLRR